MFFGLTNLPVTIQTMINDLLRDIVETENVAAFINNMMMGTKMEKGHNNIVKEVLRRMVENDLFVKPKKYMQKVREVGFLRVVIKTRQGKNEEREGSGSSGLASTKKYEGYVEVFGVGKLLQTVCQRLCKNSKTSS